MSLVRPGQGLSQFLRVDLVCSTMESYNVHEAKTHLSRILARVEAGEEVVVARSGRPIARIVPYGKPPGRRPNRWAGRLRVAADFNAPLPADLLDAFEGRS